MISVKDIPVPLNPVDIRIPYFPKVTLSHFEMNDSEMPFLLKLKRVWRVMRNLLQNRKYTIT